MARNEINKEFNLRNYDDDDIRSEDARELLGKSDKGIIGKAFNVLLIISGIFVALFFLIKVPDVTIQHATIEVLPKPLVLYTNHPGYIKQVYVENADIVKPNSAIVELENDVGYKNILDLKLVSKSIDTVLYNRNFARACLTILNYKPVGSEATFYQDIANNINEYLHLLKGFKAQDIRKEIFTTGIETVDSRYFFRPRNSNYDEVEKLFASINCNKRNLDSFINDWEQKYLIANKTSQERRVYYSKALRDNDYLSSNEVIGECVNLENFIIAKMAVSALHADKIVVGQKVSILIESGKKKASFNGVVLNKIKSKLPVKETYKKYWIIVKIPDIYLPTNKIDFIPGLVAVVKFSGKNQSLFKKLFMKN